MLLLKLPYSTTLASTIPPPDYIIRTPYLSVVLDVFILNETNYNLIHIFPFVVRTGLEPVISYLVQCT